MIYKILKLRWQRITALVLLSCISLILIIALIINNYWSPVLAGKLTDAVSESSDGLYTIKFSSAELHVLRGSIVIYNLTLMSDTAVYNKKKKQHLAPNNLIALNIKRLTLTDIHPLTLYFRNELKIGNIFLNRPDLKISYQLNHTKDTTVKDNRTPWQRISKNLHSIQVDNIVLNDVKFRYEDYSGHKVAISELKEMNLNAYDLLIDSATQTDKSRLLYCKDVIVQLNNFKGKTPDGLYSYSVNSLTLSTQKSQLNINGLTLKPVAPAVFFDKTLMDRFSLNLDSLQLNNFDFLNYQKYRLLTATSVVLHSGEFQVFGNPRQSPNQSDGIRTFPNAAFNKIKADIKIDTILLKRINIVYNEYNTKTKKTGSLSFNRTSGRFLNITTNKTALKRNAVINAELTTYFMNRGKINVAFNFNLLDKNNAFDYHGTLGPMNLQLINQATMPLAMVKISSGSVKQFDFDIHADRTAASGRVTLLYNNLKVIVLKADTSQNKLKRSTIASLYANIFILKHNNPDTTGQLPRSFFVNYRRPVKAPFFQSIWQTLLSGIKPSVGLDVKTQEASKALMKQTITKKQARKIKRAERKLRRAEKKRRKAIS